MNFFFFFAGTSRGMQDFIVPWPGIKPATPAVEVPNLNHLTVRGVLLLIIAVSSFSSPFIHFLSGFGNGKKKKKEILKHSKRRNWNRSLQSFPNVWCYTTAQGERSNSKRRDASLMTSEQHRKQPIPSLSLACHETAPCFKDTAETFDLFICTAKYMSPVHTQSHLDTHPWETNLG